MSKVKEHHVETIVDSLCSNMLSDNEQLRDISSIGEVTVVKMRFSLKRCVTVVLFIHVGLHVKRTLKFNISDLKFRLEVEYENTYNFQTAKQLHDCMSPEVMLLRR